MVGGRLLLGLALLALAAAAPAAEAAAPAPMMYAVWSTSATSSAAYGVVDDGGQPATAHFGYDLKSSAWCTTGGVVGTPGHSTTDKPYDNQQGFAYETLDGLTAGAQYCIALVATNASGTVTSSMLTFTQGAPSVGTDSVSSTSATTSDVLGSVDGAAQTTTYRVDFDVKSSAWCSAKGASGTPAHSTTAQPLPAPNDQSHDVTVTLSALTAGTAYCAAVVATNGSATTASTPVEFVQGQPTAYTGFAYSESATTATISGDVDPAGQTTTYRVGYDLAGSTWCVGDGSGTPANATPPQTLGTTSAGLHSVSVDLAGLTGGTAYCARVLAANGSGSSPPESFAAEFTPGLPEAWLADVSSTGPTTTRVTGYVRTLGQSTTYHVAYDLATSDWCVNDGRSGTPAHTTPDQSVTNDTGGSNKLSVAVTGLASGTTYCVALVATNASGTRTSFTESITQGAPRIHYQHVHSTGPTATTVSGTVNPLGQTTTYHVAYDVATSVWCTDYGSDGTPAHTTADQTLSSTDATSHEVSVALSGLTAGTGYCAELVAHNAAGTTAGWMQTFTQGTPEATTTGAYSATPSTSTITGTVNPIAQATTYRVDWDLASSDWCQSYSDDPSVSPAHSTTAQPLSFSDDADHPVTAEVTGLTAGQKYCASVVAVNGSGPSRGYRFEFTQGAPEATLDDAHPTGTTTATAAGTVNPAGQATTYHLAYDTADSSWCSNEGTSGTPAHTTAETALGATDAVAHAVTANLSGLALGTDYCVGFVATNAAGTSTSWTQQFRQGAPGVRVDDVQPNGGSAATVTGFVNAAAQTTTYHVEWDLAGSDWCESGGWLGAPAHTSTTQTFSFSDGQDHPLSIDISGLAARTDHCVAIIASNASGSKTTDQAFFTAGTDAPTVSTGAAGALSMNSATLHGTVAPHGTATSYHFEYGPTTAYGTSTPTAGAGTGETAQAVSAVLGGLTPATTYHYRLVATNAGGTNAGADMTFTTPAPNPPPPDPPKNDPPPHDNPPPPPPADNPSTPAQTGSPPTTGSSGPSPTRDTTAPHVTASLRATAKLKLLLRRGVSVNAGCDEQCEATVTLVIPAKLAKKLKLAPGLATATTMVDAANAPVRVAIALPAKVRARLAHAGAFTLTVAVTAKDRSGNAGATTQTVAVSR